MATRHAWCPAQCIISRMGVSCKLSLVLNLYRALGRDAAPCTAQLSEPQQASKLCTYSHPPLFHLLTSPTLSPQGQTKRAKERVKTDRGMGICANVWRAPKWYEFYDAVFFLRNWPSPWLTFLCVQVCVCVHICRCWRACGVSQIYSVHLIVGRRGQCQGLLTHS